MDAHVYSSCGQSSLINELLKGMEVANQLRAQLGPEYSVDTKEMLLQRILSSYDKALYILGWGRASEQPHQLLPAPLPIMPSSSVSTMGSPKSEDLHVGFNNSYQDDKQKSKKRKAESTWTQKLTVNSGATPDAPPADGYNWRKYGQKDILGTKHPRSYYRCTYRSVYNCWATKQIQKSDEDPTMFHITYKGKHACTAESRSKSAPTSPGKQQAKPDDLLNMEYQQDSAMSLSLQNTPIANTQNTDFFPFPWTEFGLLRGESSHFLPSTINNTDSFYRSFSPSLTPSTSGSNYFSMSPCTTDTFASLHHQEHNFETDIAEMLSVTISGTESATIEQDFSADTWIFNPNLPANNQ